MNVEIVEVNSDHILYLAENARKSDAEEIAAWDGTDITDALIYSVIDSGEESYTALIDSVPVAIFGAAQHLWKEDTALPWMIATDELEKHAFAVVRQNVKFINQWLKKWDCLENHVAEKNVKAIEWLNWLGFRFSSPEPLGINGAMFMRFERRA